MIRLTRKETLIFIQLLHKFLESKGKQNKMLRWTRAKGLQKHSYPDKMDILGYAQVMFQSNTIRSLYEAECLLLFIFILGDNVTGKYLSITKEFSSTHKEFQEVFNSKSKIRELLKLTISIFEELPFPGTLKQLKVVLHKKSEELFTEVGYQMKYLEMIIE